MRARQECRETRPTQESEMAKSTATKKTAPQRANAQRAAPATRGKTAKRNVDEVPAKKTARPAPVKSKGDRKPAPAIAPGEQGPKKVAKPVKNQGDKIEEPARSKPMSMRDLLEARQARVRQGPSWPDADPHNHRATENAEPPADEQASEKAHEAEAKNMDPTQRDRRSKHQPRGPR